MATMFIDGDEYEFRPGQTVLQLAHEVGIDVPYFCYHPGLSVAGNCRMCLVEFEGGRKPDISCNMACKEGLKVFTQTDSVKKLQKGVMEFLLLNHPLDCPVCDQAGECWLQEYYMDYARHPSALRDHKTVKPKAVPLGPQVILDAERCILCTRCIRFLDEVSGTSELTIVDRGGHAEISLFPGERLENFYSSNVADICPVGALTLRDFRFKQRVWFLKTTDSVCTVCANGCNLHVDSNAVDRAVYRVRPRTNMDVNRYWMCDLGRDTYKPTNAESRVRSPRVEGRDVGWADAASELGRRLEALEGKAIAAVAGPMSTNENLWAFRRFATEVLEAGAIAKEVSPQATVTAVSDDFLIKADKTPNRAGLDAVFDGVAVPFEKIRDGIEAGTIKALFVLENDLVRLSTQPDATRELLGKLDLLVTIVANHDEVAGAATVVLPGATVIEMDGTLTNFSGRVQRVRPAFAPKFESRPAWAVLDYIAESINGKGLGLPGWDGASDVFDEMATKVDSFAGLSYAVIGDQGAIRKGAEPVRPPAKAGAAGSPAAGVH